MSWLAIAKTDERGHFLEAHVIPQHDNRGHLESSDCWCGPRVLEDDEDPEHPIYHHRAD